MKNHFLLALLLLKVAEASTLAVASPQQVSQNQKLLFQLTEVSACGSALISEKGDAKCGAGSCGSIKKSKSAEKHAEQKPTEKAVEKTHKGEMKCGAGACGSTKSKEEHSKK